MTVGVAVRRLLELNENEGLRLILRICGDPSLREAALRASNGSFNHFLHLRPRPY
ncbi:MAG: hypothetical protein ACI81P_003476 [Neolewinella sp.]|jgi:hypothetical protein